MWAVDPNDEVGTLRYELEEAKRKIDKTLKMFDEKPIVERGISQFVIFLAKKEYVNISQYMVDKFLTENYGRENKTLRR